MAVVLALASALSFGAADFLGGLATRRANAIVVLVVSQLAGLVVLVLLLPVLAADDATTRDAVLGAAGGLIGGAGLFAFYSALARGAMTVVAPITAVFGAGVPVAVGVVTGERPALLAWLGIAVALPSIALVSREHHTVELHTPRIVLLMAVAAGTSFGLFFVVLDRTGDDAGVVPLVAARLCTVVLIGLPALAVGRLARPERSHLRLVVPAGVLDMAANVCVLYAFREGLLSIVSVTSGLYPATTVILARVVLRENLSSTQLVGLVGAAVSVSFVALA